MPRLSRCCHIHKLRYSFLHTYFRLMSAIFDLSVTLTSEIIHISSTAVTRCRDKASTQLTRRGFDLGCLDSKSSAPSTTPSCLSLMCDLFCRILSFCSLAFGDCPAYPCQFDATCYQQTNGTFKACHCKAGYTGWNCAIGINVSCLTSFDSLQF